ncbi:phasin family protein [Massilia sp. Leaf139]|uniref:phasin family protein n=1 Tax=Massilia sp. Leaf139 TaxID=1736272 RepID=UPI0006F5BC55|nr:phasin family protein [Massilia sp. Leaf139]KQQ89056.1 hypothetical protein ASF77_10180 [Massilia sp. Leaf139]
MPAFSSSLPDLRTQLATQVDFLDQVSRHTVDTLKQLSELNVHMARDLLDDGIRLGRALAGCKDPLQMGSTAMREIPTVAEHWRHWHNALLGVLTASGAALAHDANDGSWQAARSAGRTVDAARAGADDMGAAHNPT